MNRFECLKLVAGLLSPTFYEDREIIRKFDGKVNWELLVQVASSQLVFPTLFLRFTHHSVQEKIPQDLIEYCEHIYNLNRNRNETIKQQSLEVNECLLKNGIEPVFMKGVASLFDQVYYDPGERMMGDIDLLVPEEHFLKSVECLKDIGYKEITEFHPVDLKFMKHYPRMIHKDRIAGVEIHRQPVSEKYLSFLNNSLIYTNKKVSKTNETIFVPDDNHKSLLNFLHTLSTVNLFYFGTIFLRDLYEFYMLRNRCNDSYTGLNGRLNLQYRELGVVAGHLFDNRKAGWRSRIFLFRVKMSYKSVLWRILFVFSKVCLQLVWINSVQLWLCIKDRDYRKRLQCKLLEQGWLKTKFKNTGTIFSKIVFLKEL